MGRCPAGKIRRAAVRGRSPSSTMLGSTHRSPSASAAAPRRFGPIGSSLPMTTGTKTALLVMADTSPHVGRGRGRTAYARFLELLRGTGHRLGPAHQRQPVPADLCGPGFRVLVRMGKRPLVRWRRRHRGTQRPAATSFARIRSSRSRAASRACSMPSKNPASGRPTFPASCGKMFGRRSNSCWKTFPRPTAPSPICSPRWSHPVPSDQLTDAEAHEALLQATVRIVMRLVVCLFAESRQLLPVNDPIYAQSYGVRTLVRATGRGRPA